MRWHVEGADQENGEDVAIDIDADSRQAAEALARQRGVLVAALTEAEPSDAELLALANAHRSAAAVVEYSPALKKNKAPAVPRYIGLRIAAGVLSVLAALYYVAGLCLLVPGLYDMLRYGSGLPNVAMFIAALSGGFMFVALGGLCHGLSAGCLALRDIAINSFRQG